MRNTLIISIVLLILMYIGFLFPVININEGISIEENKIKNAKSVDLSRLSINGENFLQNRDKYHYGSKSATTNIKRHGECGNEYYFEQNPGSGLDKISIGDTNFASIECLMEYLGNDYITGISFKGIENNDAYLDKNNNIMILIRKKDYSKFSPHNWIIVKDIELYQFYRKPIFYYGPLALIDPLFPHFVGTYYSIIDRIILPIYYMIIIFPFVVKITDQDLSRKKFFKYWTILSIIIVLIAVIFLILSFYLMSMM